VTKYWILKDRLPYTLNQGMQARRSNYYIQTQQMRNKTPLVACLLMRKAQQSEEVSMKVGMNRMSNYTRKMSTTTGHWAHNYTLHLTVHCRTVDSVLLYIGITARCIQEPQKYCGGMDWNTSIIGLQCSQEYSTVLPFNLVSAIQ
jgi:hypothetical protein